MTWFKKSTEPAFNLHHPDLRENVEVAFRVVGKTYYRFKEEVEIPSGRYTFIDAFLREHEMRMSIDVLKGYISAIRDEISGQKGEVNLHNVAVLLYKMESRANLAFTPDTIKRLASVIYFDDTEKLNTYDQEYGKKKIELWDREKVDDFFFEKPIGELLGLQGISRESLQNYLTEATQLLQDLTSSPQTSSGPSS